MIRLLGAALGHLSGREPAGVEARLRGLVSRGLKAGPGLRVGRRVEFFGRSRITIGANVAFSGDSILNACGVHGSIDIGDDSQVDCFCVLYGQGGIRIGRGCAIASGVIVYSQTNQYLGEPTKAILDQEVVYGEVAIGNDVWIGAGATILPGVKIGDHAVIGARALVRSDVPDWMVAVGVPATLLKDRRSPHEQRA